MKFVAFVATSVVFGVTSCKAVKTTNAPGAKSGADSSDASGKVALVKGADDVPFETIPRLTVNVDLTDCIGQGKWLDPTAPVTTRVGAVSVTPTRNDQTGDSQPLPWVFEPIRRDESTPVKTVDSYPWRINRGSYKLEVVAYNVVTSEIESELKRDFDFSKTNDLAIKIVGKWESAVPSGFKCKLVFQ